METIQPKGLPKVSVIVCTYNYGHFIGRCLDALANQTLKDIEIIIVDNHSTDNTEEVVAPYLKDQRIRYIRNPENYKAYRSYRIGFEAARGEYIGISDADDFHALDAFEKLYNAAFEHNADISSGNCVDAPGNREVPAFPGSIEEKNSLIDVALLMRNLAGVWCSLFRKSIVDKSLQDWPKDQRLTHGVDELLSIGLYYNAKKRVHIADRIYNHCQNLSSASRSGAVEKIGVIENRVDQIKDFAIILDFLRKLSIRDKLDKKHATGIWNTESWHTKIAYYALRVVASKENTIRLWNEHASPLMKDVMAQMLDTYIVEERNRAAAEEPLVRARLKAAMENPSAVAEEEPPAKYIQYGIKRSFWFLLQAINRRLKRFWAR